MIVLCFILLLSDNECKTITTKETGQYGLFASVWQADADRVC